MPALTCPDCQAVITDRTRACPACGCPPEEFQRSDWDAPGPSERVTDERYSIETEPEPTSPARHLFFPVSPSKLAVMSICTLGLYHVYWSYQQWDRIRIQSGERLSPLLRAIFTPLWNFSLFGRVQRAADAHDLPREWNPLLLATGYLVLQAALRAPDPVWLLPLLLSFVPLAMVQQTITRINRAGAATEGANDRFSGLNVFGIMVGGLVVLLLLADVVLPPPT